MVSFKISKIGTRYRPKLSSGRVQAGNPQSFSPTESGSHKISQVSNGPQHGGGSAAGGGKFGTSTAKLSCPSSLPSKRSCSDLVEGAACTSKKKRGETIQAAEDKDLVGDSLTSTPVSENQPKDREASFAVNLFKFGFSLSKPTEKTKEAPNGYEVMQNSYPYDRTTENFLRALDGGWLPGDLLDDIPCTYIDGCVVCELRDYRRSTPVHDTILSSERDMSMDWTPKITRILLQPSTETIVKDVAAMADETWTYSDFLEAEAKILKFVQPPLCLDPGVALARKAYTENFNKLKFNIGCPALRRYRMPKDASADRRFRIAASAKIFSKIGKLYKPLNRISEKGSGSAGSYTAHEVAQDSFPLLPLDGGMNTNSSAPGQMLSGLAESSTLSQALSAQNNMNHPSLLRGPLSLPIQPLHGPCSPSSDTLGTGSVTSANGDIKGIPKSSHLSKRDSNDFAAGGREECKKQRLEQLRLLHQQHMMPLRKDKDQQDQQFQEQRSTDLLKQRQMMLNQLYQDQVTRPDASGFFPFDQGHLDLKPTGLEGNKPATGIEQNQEDVEKYQQEWNKDGLELAEGVLSREQLQQSNALNEDPQISQLPLGSHPGMVVPGQGQSPLWQTGQGFDVKTGLKVERDSVLDEYPQRKVAPSASSQQALPTQLPGAMKGPLSGSAMGLPSAIPLSLQTMSPQPGNTPKSPAQMVASSFHSGVAGQPDSMLLSPQYSVLNSHSLRRPSLPKMQSVASPSQSNSVASPLLNSPSTGSAPLSTAIVKGEGMTQPGVTGPQALYQRKLNIDSRAAVQPSQLALLDIIHRMKMLSAKEPVAGSADKDLPPPNRNPPSFQLVAVALADNSTDDPPEAKGRRSMANSLVGGNINARKSRTLKFEKTEHIPQGRGMNPRNVQSHTYLTLCGQVQDTLVEAGIHISDFENEGQPLPASPCVLPPLANPEKADQFATQYAALMLKEGWELTEDNVQPRGATATTNAATNARPMPAGATTLGNTMSHPASSPRVLMSQQHMAVVPGSGISPLNQMQPPSPNAAATARMPPPANSNRQILPNHMGQQVAGKPLQMDVAVSPLAAVQQQQQHQLHHQHQQHLQLQQHQSQRQQQLMANPQLVAQLGAQGGNPQMNHAGQIAQLQYLRQQQSMLQRKMMLPNNMNNLGVGLNGGSNIGSMNGVGLPVSGGAQSMPSISGLGSMAGLANSIGGMSALANMGQLSAMSNMGQAGGVVNMMSPQLRPGLLNGAQAAMAGKRLPAGRGRATGTGSPVRSTMDSLPMAGANRMLANPGVPIMSHQQIPRNGLVQPLQRQSVTGMTLPKVGTPVMGTGVSPQGFYMNPQQKNTQQIPGGGLSTLVGVPPSTQVSSQGLGSVVGLSSAAMDLQNVPRTTAPGQGQVRRPMMTPSQSGQPGQQSQ